AIELMSPYTWFVWGERGPVEAGWTLNAGAQIELDVVFIPGTMTDRLINLGMGTVFLGLGIWMCYVDKRKKAS
ncbi:MAG: hypothetical protein U9P14_05785, partial [Gemmatimonadota bacterium]|nr:hypothetical protein [Gemmatimonadota bacterium]